MKKGKLRTPRKDSRTSAKRRAGVSGTKRNENEFPNYFRDSFDPST